jgi:hypothetical protein
VDGTGMRREWEYLALAPADLARRLDEPVIVLGDAADQIDSPYARRIRRLRRGPSPAAVGFLGIMRLAMGDTVAPSRCRTIISGRRGRAQAPWGNVAVR